MLGNRLFRIPAGQIRLKPPRAGRKNDNARIGQVKTGPWFLSCIQTYTRIQSVWKIDHPCFLMQKDFFCDGGGFQINGGSVCPCRSGGSVVGLSDDLLAG